MTLLQVYHKTFNDDKLATMQMVSFLYNKNKNHQYLDILILRRFYKNVDILAKCGFFHANVEDIFIFLTEILELLRVCK